MQNKDDNLSSIDPFLNALKTAIKANGENQNLDCFVEDVLKNLENSQSSTNDLEIQKDKAQVTSILQNKNHLTVELFNKYCCFSQAQIKLLIKLKIISIKNGSVYFGMVYSIPLVSAAILISLFTSMSIAIAMAILLNPFPGVWLWSFAFGIGGFIGIGIGMTLDRSFRIYKLIDKLESLISLLPLISRKIV